MALAVACLRALAPLVLLAAELAAATRVSVGGNGPRVGDVALDHVSTGVAHKTLKRFDPLTSRFFTRNDLKDEIPGDLDMMLEDHDLQDEYKSLIDDVARAGKGMLGNWKCSEIERALYLNGHEAAFVDKGVKVYLTKRENEASLPTIKLYFVDIEETPQYILKDVYSDAATVSLPYSMQPVTVSMQPGVYAQPYGTERSKQRKIQTKKSDMPVALLKLLERQDAMPVYSDFAAVMNTGKMSNAEVASTLLRQFEGRFRTQGIGVTFHQYSDPVECEYPLCSRWRMWFQYADLKVYAGSAIANKFAYPAKKLTNYEACMNLQAATHTGVMVWNLGAPSSPLSCGGILGATGQTNAHATSSHCKCAGYGESVYCGKQRVVDRKFSWRSVFRKAQCEQYSPRRQSQGRVPYCARHACGFPGDEEP